MKILLYICLNLVSILYSQTLSGIIIDKDTNQPLAGCNISIFGTNRGAISNNEGHYFLTLSSGEQKIIFQYIGFKSDTLFINVKKISITKDIYLSPQLFMSDNIVVFPGKYSEAEQLIIRASREKKKNLKLLQNYDCRSYTKISISGWVDSLKDNYAMIMEAYSELIWNSPNDWHEVIKSLRTTANIPHSISWLNGNSFLDINSDRIQLGKKVIIGPTAPDAIKYYNYKIVDTLYQDNRRIYKMNIEPKENIRPLMGGQIYLIDKLFIIQKIDIKLNKNANFGMFEDIYIAENYKPFKDNIYLPNHSYWESAWILGLPGFPKLRYRKTNFREGYQINREDNNFLKGTTKIEIDESVPFDSVKMNIPPLSLSEVKGYVYMDSLVNTKATLRFMANSIKLIDFFSDLQKLPIGDFSDFYHFNRVEGNFLGLAFDSKKLFKSLELKLGYGYGLRDKKGKYLIKPGFKFILDKATFGFNVSFYKKLKSREENKLLPVWYNTFQSLIKNFDYFDYYYSQGNELDISLNNGPYNLGVRFFSEKHTNAKRRLKYALFGGDAFQQNPEINEGRDAGYKIQFGYSSIAYKQSVFSKREITNHPFINLGFSYQQGIKKLDSDFEYQKITAAMFLHQNTFYNGFLDFTFLGSKGTSGLPSQKWDELESGFEGYRRFKTIRTLDQNAMFGRNKIATYLEHNFHNSLFRLSHLPVIKELNYDLILIYNAGWAGNKSFAVLQLKDFYQEVGFGIGRIFNFFQVDFLWRLNRFPYSHNFMFTIKVMEFEL